MPLLPGVYDVVVSSNVPVAVGEGDFYDIIGETSGKLLSGYQIMDTRFWYIRCKMLIVKIYNGLVMTMYLLMVNCM